MLIVRRGATRTVLLVGRYAVKVPSFRGVCTRDFRGRLASLAAGLLANQSEHLWYQYEGWDGRVAPVLHSWLGGFVQVYPRCDPLPDRAVLPSLEPCPGDVKPDNFGVLGRRVVRLDYSMA